MKFRRGKSQSELSKASKRAAKLPTGELVSWCDISVMTLGQSLDNWRYHSGRIADVRDNVAVIKDLVAELEQRELHRT